MQAERFLVIASQSTAWLFGHLLKLRFAVSAHAAGGFPQRGSDRCLILSSTHRSLLDPWLIMSALRYGQFRQLIPIRFLATQTFHAPLSWFKPLIRILYRIEGVVELPPKDENDSLPTKVHGLLEALRAGKVVVIFPEGELWKKREPPIGEFAPGVVYLQRKAGADIVPIAVWTSERGARRRKYIIEIGRPVRIPEQLDLEAGAAWLRERTLELYEWARRRGTRAADHADRRLD
ncbi:MAG: lysophospholipid acyltransferase family protein [Gemmatimonadota bacterium]